MLGLEMASRVLIPLPFLFCFDRISFFAVQFLFSFPPMNDWYKTFANIVDAIGRLQRTSN